MGTLFDFKRARPWPAKPMRPADTMVLIEAFRHALGTARLSAAAAKYVARRGELGSLGSMRIEDKQPLIDSFEMYKRKTFDGRRKLKDVEGNLALLASVALHAHVLLPTLPAANRQHHFSALLNPDGPFWPTLLEWKTAAELARRTGAELAWGTPRYTGPEFVARSRGIEWNVECKHVTDMVMQAVGDAELGAAIDCITEAVIAHGLIGALMLHLSPGIDTKWKPDLEILQGRLRSTLVKGVIAIDLGQGMSLSGVLAPMDGLRLLHTTWIAEVEKQKRETSLVFGHAQRDGIYAVNPITITVDVPKRPLEELSDDLWEKKFKKAAIQCGNERGAMFSFEWHGLDDASVFERHPLFQDLLARTFDEYRHVAAIFLRCGSPPARLDGLIDFGAPAYLAKSSVTNYPEVAALIDLDQ